MKSKKKAVLTEPVTWTKVSSSTQDPSSPPAPVQFTARQLSYLNTLLLLELELQRRFHPEDTKLLEVIKGAQEAARRAMREWWDRQENKGLSTLTVSFRMDGKTPSAENRGQS